MSGPVCGSAFYITGKGVANPVATFWTAALMLEHRRTRRCGCEWRSRRVLQG